jgi:hypothetical protein
MTMTGRWKTLVGATLAATVALTGLVTSSASAQAPSLLSQPSIKKLLLTLPQIQAVSKVGSPMSADELTCHHAPYLKGTFVNYCYYTALRSTPAYVAGKWFPSHVDIISLASSAVAKAYLLELKTARKPATILSFTPTYAVFYDKDGPIATPAVGGKPAGSVLGPVVSVYATKGPVAVYTACADPKATTSTAMVTCARALANAQLARIPAVAGP